MLLPKYSKVEISPALMERLVAVAHQAADAASVPSTANFRQTVDIENKLQGQGFDPVTIADRQAEAEIKTVVQSAFPEHGFFGEESERNIKTDQPMWIVDPIDGTRAYITGMPLWGTLIAVYDGSDAVLGILEQPILKERFVGTCYHSGDLHSQSIKRCAELITPSGTKPLTTRNTQNLDVAIAQTTTPDFFTDQADLKCFQALKDSVSMVRYGGDCYCYALLAMGYIDVVIERLLEPYDIAALIPIVEGAGGKVTDWQGGSAVSGGAVVASANAQLHDKVLARLNPN